MPAFEFLGVLRSTNPDRPNANDLVVDNDLLPWQHLITAHNYPDGFGAAQSGYTGLISNAAWPFSVVAWTSADQAEVHFDVYTAAGTWTLEWMCDTRADYPIQRMLVDSVQVGADVDHYAPTANRTRFVHRIPGIVLTRGWHRFTRKAVGRNASATGWTMTVSGFGLTRMA